MSRIFGSLKMVKDQSLPGSSSQRQNRDFTASACRGSCINRDKNCRRTVPSYTSATMECRYNYEWKSRHRFRHTKARIRAPVNLLVYVMMLILPFIQAYFVPAPGTSTIRVLPQRILISTQRYAWAKTFFVSGFLISLITKTFYSSSLRYCDMSFCANI